jgi:hypothetical protein
MNYWLVCISLLCLLFWSCSSEITPEPDTSTPPLLTKYQVRDTSIIDPVKSKFSLSQISEHEYEISVFFELANDQYIVSPYSKDSIYGHFEMSLPVQKHVELSSVFKEIPSSSTVFDPATNDSIRVYNHPTTFKQNLKVLTHSDFITKGVIWFVLEPTCIPYETTFWIESKNGNLVLTKGDVMISSGY